MKGSRGRIKAALIAFIGIALLAGIAFSPGAPWSSRFRYRVKRLAAKFESSVAAWQGHQPRPVSISGTLTGTGAFVEASKGARVVAVESASGYAALSDGEGRFVLPHLVWYPGATYTLVITADTFHAKSLRLQAPSAYPQDGIIEAGELRLDEGREPAVGDGLARHLEYDAENRSYYRALFERLAANQMTDHQSIDAVCKYVSTRHNPREDAWSFKSARQIIERGAPHCSNLAFAMAAITVAGGYPTRTVHTSNTPEYARTHVAVEVFYGDGWHLYDPTYGIFFLNGRGAVASYKELRLNSGLIGPEAFGELRPEIIRSALEWMLGAYNSGLHQIYQVNEAAFAEACPLLGSVIPVMR